MSDHAFLLRIPTAPTAGYGTTISIRAYDDLVPRWDHAGRIRLTVEVKHGSKVVFPKGQLTCALHGSSDGIQAKELVMAMVAMHPGAGGGEGEDYYAGYTPEQLAWCEGHGAALDMVRMNRYCDPETGECRDGRPALARR